MTHIRKLDNGLTVIVEKIPHLRSVAYDLLIPGGVLTDASGKLGLSLLLGELCTRGAGSLSSRDISQAFDERGIRHGEGGGLSRYVFRGSCLAEQLPEALRLVSLMVLSPKLPEEEISPIRDMLLQDIQSLEDQPAQKLLVRLSANHYPAPYNRNSQGETADIQSLSLTEVQEHWRQVFAPEGSVLSVAGQVDADTILPVVEKFFSSWKGRALVLPEFGSTATRQYVHDHKDSAQTQIGVAYPSAKLTDALYSAARVVNSILSGGMHGRLFVEVREKRGLCYSVYSRHSGTERYGTVTAYAGTTPERAQETLDVLLAELERASQGITAEELERAKANILASVLMSEESAGSRAISNAGDYAMLGRVRSLEEIQAAIESVQVSQIEEYVEKFSPRLGTVQTLGPGPLHIADQKAA